MRRGSSVAKRLALTPYSTTPSLAAVIILRVTVTLMHATAEIGTSTVRRR